MRGVGGTVDGLSSRPRPVKFLRILLSVYIYDDNSTASNIGKGGLDGIKTGRRGTSCPNYPLEGQTRFMVETASQWRSGGTLEIG